LRFDREIQHAGTCHRTRVCYLFRRCGDRRILYEVSALSKECGVRTLVANDSEADSSGDNKWVIRRPCSHERVGKSYGIGQALFITVNHVRVAARLRY